MFGSCMTNRIGNKRNDVEIIHQIIGSASKEMCNLDRREHNQSNLDVMVVSAQYSVSVLDLGIVLCFLKLHIIRLDPRNKTISKVNIQSSELEL